MTTLAIVRGPGVTPAVAAEETAMELAAIRSEALAAIDACWPHLSALHRASEELGPPALHHSLALSRLLRSLERKLTRFDEADEATNAAAA